LARCDLATQSKTQRIRYSLHTFFCSFGHRKDWDGIAEGYSILNTGKIRMWVSKGWGGKVSTTQGVVINALDSSPEEIPRWSIYMDG
jgi:hypothetical protein